MGSCNGKMAAQCGGHTGKLYLCAGSCENTAAFCHKLGWAEAMKKNEALPAEDPNDLQLPFYGIY